MMGRSIKMREKCMAFGSVLLHAGIGFGRRGNRHVRAREKKHLAVGNDGLARCYAILDDHIPLNRAAHRNDARLHGLIGLHDVNKLALLPCLNGFRRDDSAILGRLENKHDLHKLPGPQDPFAIVERGLQVNRAGLRVDCVVNDAEATNDLR